MELGKDRNAGKTYVRVGTGYSTVKDSGSAGKEAAEKSIASMKRKYNLNGVKPDDLTLTMVFSSTRYELEQMLEGVRAVTGSSPLVGCTTAGEITDEGVHNNSVSVMTLSSEVISAGTGVGENLVKDAPGAGEKAISEALEKMQKYNGKKISEIKQEISYFKDPLATIRFNPFSVLMFPQGRVLPEFILYDEEIIRGMRRKVGYQVPIIGGSSANGSRMEKSFQFCDEKVYKNSVVCAILFSLVNVGFSTSHPFIPTEKRTQATELKQQWLLPQGEIKSGYTILELDNVPAAERYFELIKDKLIPERNFKEWLEEVGDIPSHLYKYEKQLNYPFGLHDLYGNIWIKMLSRIKKDKSLELVSLIPNDSVLNIMELKPGKTRTELVCETAEKAIKGAMFDANIEKREEIAVVFVFDCAARYQMIEEEDPGKEVEAIKGIAGEDTPIIGFYTYGELLSTLQAPIGRLEQTCTVMIITQTPQGAL